MRNKLNSYYVTIQSIFSKSKSHIKTFIKSVDTFTDDIISKTIIFFKSKKNQIKTNLKKKTQELIIKYEIKEKIKEIKYYFNMPSDIGILDAAGIEIRRIDILTNTILYSVIGYIVLKSYQETYEAANKKTSLFDLLYIFISKMWHRVFYPYYLFRDFMYAVGRYIASLYNKYIYEPWLVWIHDKLPTVLQNELNLSPWNYVKYTWFRKWVEDIWPFSHFLAYYKMLGRDEVIFEPVVKRLRVPLSEKCRILSMKKLKRMKKKDREAYDAAFALIDVEKVTGYSNKRLLQIGYTTFITRKGYRILVKERYYPQIIFADYDWPWIIHPSMIRHAILAKKAKMGKYYMENSIYFLDPLAHRYDFNFYRNGKKLIDLHVHSKFLISGINYMPTLLTFLTGFFIFMILVIHWLHKDLKRITNENNSVRSTYEETGKLKEESDYSSYELMNRWVNQEYPDLYDLESLWIKTSSCWWEALVLYIIIESLYNVYKLHIKYVSTFIDNYDKQITWMMLVICFVFTMFFFYLYKVYFEDLLKKDLFKDYPLVLLLHFLFFSLTAVFIYKIFRDYESVHMLVKGALLYFFYVCRYADEYDYWTGINQDYRRELYEYNVWWPRWVNNPTNVFIHTYVVKPAHKFGIVLFLHFYLILAIILLKITKIQNIIHIKIRDRFFLWKGKSYSFEEVENKWKEDINYNYIQEEKLKIQEQYKNDFRIL